MRISDKATISTRRTLPNGALQVDAVFARTGIQIYSRGELGDDVPEAFRDSPANTPIRVWRPAAEVFAQAAIDSFGAVALTINHPAEDVTPKNFKQLAHGLTGEKPFRDDYRLKGTITFSTETAIDKLEKSSGELSNGYDCELEWTSGVVPDGEHDAGQTFDAIQRNIIGNHVALVDAGRCGAECRVLDAKTPAPVQDHASCNCEGDSQMADGLIKKVVDGFGLVESTTEGFAVIDSLAGKAVSLQTQLDTAAGAVAAKDQAHADAVAAKDKEIADLKAAQLDDKALDARVAARATLVTDARRISGKADLVVDGLADLDVQKAAVTAKLGDDKVKGWNDTQFTGAFAYMVADTAETGGDGQGGDTKTPQTSGLGDALRPTPIADGKKSGSYEDRMANRWKAGQKKDAA